MANGTGKGSNSTHVVPNANGGWDVKAGGGEKASSHHATKQEAVDKGRQVSQNKGTEFVIHNEDGKIAQKNSHGNDPRNTPG